VGTPDLQRYSVKRTWSRSPQDWLRSNFRHYALREIGAVQIESEWTARDREGNLLLGGLKEQESPNEDSGQNDDYAHRDNHGRY
jgi:hypothetical protein